MPAIRHHNGCTVSFADGHAELWKFYSPTTMWISAKGDARGQTLRNQEAAVDFLRFASGIPTELPIH